MAAPSTYALSILIDDNEVISFTPFDSMDFDDYPKQVSYFRFTVEAPTTAPARQDTVVISSNGVTIFDGFIMELGTKKRDNGIKTIYEIEAADKKILLQKTVMDFSELTGSDADILASLLTNAYPDLSADFDFSTGVTSILSDMALTTNNDSLLDNLNNLSDLSGGADWRFDNGGSTPLTTITFDDGGAAFTAITTGTASVTIGGNTGNCYKATSLAPSEYIQVTFDAGVASSLINLSFEYFFSDANVNSIQIQLVVDGSLIGIAYDLFVEDAWTFEGMFTVDNFPAAGQVFGVRLTADSAPHTMTDVRIDNMIVTEGTFTEHDVTFDVGGGAYSVATNGTAAIAAVGNPDNCYQATALAANTGYIEVEIDLGISAAIAHIEFDHKEIGGGNSPSVQLYVDGSTHGISHTLPTISIWRSFKNLTDVLPATGQVIKIRVTAGVGSPPTDLRIDNFLVSYQAGTEPPALQWSNTPDLTDFNFDIQSGDEFAFDIDTFEGDIDDFNSITVIGGKEDVAIDWTYESRGDQDHFDLEVHVKDIVVYKNTGTDGTPIWTLQANGLWGTDSFTSDGGSKDVLYGREEHWLWFDTNPIDLSKSIRVTGTIEKPLRVRVEDVEAGDRTYATVIYDDAVTTKGEAVELAQATLQKRNALKRITFKTYEPNLKVGQAITIADSTRGLNETVTISNIKTIWLGASGNALFTITCGDDELTSADVMIANNDKRSRKNVAGATTSTQDIAFLVDADGITPLIDTTGDLLYEAT